MNISLKLCFAPELNVSACGAKSNRYIAMLISFNSFNISLQIVIAGLDGVTAGYTTSKKDPAPSALCLARPSDIIILRYFPVNTLLLEPFDSTTLLALKRGGLLGVF